MQIFKWITIMDLMHNFVFMRYFDAKPNIIDY